MKNSRMKKLTLNKETLRNLQDSELGQVVGGTDIGRERVKPGFAHQPAPPNISRHHPIASCLCSIEPPICH